LYIIFSNIKKQKKKDKKLLKPVCSIFEVRLGCLVANGQQINNNDLDKAKSKRPTRLLITWPTEGAKKPLICYEYRVYCILNMPI